MSLNLPLEAELAPKQGGIQPHGGSAELISSSGDSTPPLLPLCALICRIIPCTEDASCPVPLFFALLSAELKIRSVHFMANLAPWQGAPGPPALLLGSFSGGASAAGSRNNESEHETGMKKTLCLMAVHGGSFEVYWSQTFQG